MKGLKLALMFGVILFARPLVGREAFSINPSKPFSQATNITQTSNATASGKILRSPSLVQSPHSGTSKNSKQLEKLKPKANKTSKYRFAGLDVRGTKIKPSLEFKTEKLDVPLVNEQVDTNFIEKLEEAQSISSIGEGGW